MGSSLLLESPQLSQPLQGSLFGAAKPSVRPLPECIERIQLDPCCWVDVARGWFTGGDNLLEEMLSCMEWHHGERLMYGRFVDEPRLTGLGGVEDAPAIVTTLANQLATHYLRPFDRMFCNYYRDGNDSVAWHADRVGRQQVDPLVAIITVGGPRPFQLRPRKDPKSEDGGAEFNLGSESFNLHSGDLLVMGGATQHHWEHCVPKRSYAPPRMSISLRTGAGSEETTALYQSDRRLQFNR